MFPVPWHNLTTCNSYRVDFFFFSTQCPRFLCCQLPSSGRNSVLLRILGQFSRWGVSIQWPRYYLSYRYHVRLCALNVPSPVVYPDGTGSAPGPDQVWCCGIVKRNILQTAMQRREWCLSQSTYIQRILGSRSTMDRAISLLSHQY